jgi:branched-chain amino acid transport system ATP-binding protein
MGAAHGSAHALFDIECAWPETGCVGILGRNGAGKTTLLRAILAQGVQVTGEVHLLGRDVTHLKTHERASLGVGYVPQERDVFPRLTVRENLRMGAMRNGREADMTDVLGQFPRLAQRLGQLAGTLSGGERKMLALGRALLQRPRILLLDEPTEGVWHTVVDELAVTIERLSKSMLVVLVEQHIELVFDVASQCVVLDRGRIGLSDATPNIKTHDALHALLAP